VGAINPGKHGEKDWRVTFNGVAVEHAEMIAMVGFLLLAEDRYDAPGQRGRYLLWSFLDRLLINGKTPEAILDIAGECKGDIDNSPARRNGQVTI
jgi:hypothetical protein